MSTDRFSYMPFAQVPTRAAFDGRLLESDLRVLTYLASLTVNSNGYAWISQQRLANRLGVDKSTVKRSIRRLRSCGYIRVKPNGRKGPARRNRYYIIHEITGWSDRIWDVDGERVPFDGPSLERPAGGSRRPQPASNGGTAAPIMGAPHDPQEIQGRERKDLREKPNGRKPSLRDREEDFEARRQAALAYLKPFAEEEERRSKVHEQDRRGVPRRGNSGVRPISGAR